MNGHSAYGIVIAGEMHSGKTTSCRAIADHYRTIGFNVAICQIDKGIDDVFQYQSTGNPHFVMPLCVAKGTAELEKWLPVGYDLFIFEWTYPDHPEWVINNAYFEVFSPDQINQLFPFPITPANVNNCRYNPMITQAPFIFSDYPGVTNQKTVFNPQLLEMVELTPKLNLPISEKQVVGLGFFPGEFFNIFQNMVWCKQDLQAFDEALQSKNDVILLGHTHSSYQKEIQARLELVDSSADHIICYDPLLFNSKLDPIRCDGANPSMEVIGEINRVLKNAPAGSSLPKIEGQDRYYYNRFDNRYWVRTEYGGIPPICNFGNLTLCNGWVHPINLINEGYLCV